MSVIDFIYGLYSTKASSERYGDCECCGKYADTIYVLHQKTRYIKWESKKEGWLEGFRWYGHKKCLSEITMDPDRFRKYIDYESMKLKDN
jgi:hypothetical protein